MKPRPLAIDADLVLRPREAADAAQMFALVERDRADLRAWLPWIDSARTLGEIRRYAQYADAQMQARVAYDYGIYANDALVGAIGLHAIDYSNRSTAIGYWLAPAMRGRGIVTRAARRLVAHAFADLELHRLEIRCVVENVASRNVAERLGFAFEGTLSQAYYLHGRFRDLALYARVREATDRA
ncbi:MAG: GNAT family protein [Vulcanimicrobiaceae bacterium]